MFVFTGIHQCRVTNSNRHQHHRMTQDENDPRWCNNNNDPWRQHNNDPAWQQCKNNPGWSLWQCSSNNNVTMIHNDCDTTTTQDGATMMQDDTTMATMQQCVQLWLCFLFISTNEFVFFLRTTIPAICWSHSTTPSASHCWKGAMEMNCVDFRIVVEISQNQSLGGNQTE